MKKTIPILLYCFLFFVHNSNAQKIRFTDTSNKWKFEYNSWGNGNHYTYTDSYYLGDSVINGKSYVFFKDRGFVREDTTLGRVFILNDTTDYILYDYNLKVGDTFVDRYTPDTLIITQAYTIIINGINHKIWESTSLVGRAVSFILIEGIGDVSRKYFENGSWLICFKNNGSNVYITQYSSAEGCVLSVKDNIPDKLFTTITPNPANEYSTINFPYTIQQGQLLIINSIGQVVADKEVHNRQEIRLGSLSTSGLYYYKLIDKHCGNNFSGKFIYQ